MRVLICALAFSMALSARTSSPVDPPAVDEAALASRLFEMTKPTAGERAVIVFDPTYYPDITTKLREALHARGVQTFAIVEDSPAMVASYMGDAAAHDQREREIVDTWRPVFQRS